jgi:hypothetical protein
MQLTSRKANNIALVGSETLAMVVRTPPEQFHAALKALRMMIASDDSISDADHRALTQMHMMISAAYVQIHRDFDERAVSKLQSHATIESAHAQRSVAKDFLTSEVLIDKSYWKRMWTSLGISTAVAGTGTYAVSIVAELSNMAGGAVYSMINNPAGLCVTETTVPGTMATMWRDTTVQGRASGMLSGPLCGIMGYGADHGIKPLVTLVGGAGTLTQIFVFIALFLFVFLLFGMFYGGSGGKSRLSKLTWGLFGMRGGGNRRRKSRRRKSRRKSRRRKSRKSRRRKSRRRKSRRRRKKSR